MSCCEDHSALQPIARLGLSFMKSKRSVIMIITTVLNVVSFVLLCVAMAGASNDSGVIKSSAWTLGKFDGDLDLWVGLKSFTGVGGTFEWDSNACVANYCDKCSTAGENALNATAIAFVCTIGIVILSILRFRPSDMVVLKVTSCIISLVAFFCLIIAMGVWSNQCVDSLPSGYDYTLGAGFNCVVVSFLVLFYTFIVHLLTPVDFSSTTEPTLTTAIPVGASV
jgi:hypothetical protein